MTLALVVGGVGVASPRRAPRGAAAARMALQLVTAGLTSNELGFSDCAYVHKSTMEQLAAAGGIDPAAAIKRGVLAAVGEAVLYVKCVSARARAHVLRGMDGRRARRGAAPRRARESAAFRRERRRRRTHCAARALRALRATALAAAHAPRAPVSLSLSLYLSLAPPPPRRELDKALPGKVHVNMFHRLAGSLQLDKPHPVSAFTKYPTDYFTLSQVALELSTLNNNNAVTIDAGELAATVQAGFHGHVYKVGQQFAAIYRAGQPDEVKVKLVVKSLEFLDMKTSTKAAVQPVDAGSRFGQFTRATEVALSKAASAANVKITGSSSGKANKLFAKGFNFEELGIGGLDAQFKEIFRRAFSSRLVPPEILRRMGQNHVRGMLLFGPPGCGKTLIARKIGKALQARPPKVVNGPEILNKFVGQSEENIRALFADAEKEQAEKGDDSELHIIIFDEFDAIAKQRGTTGGGTGVNDSIVNQLLSKIDGVDALNNILLIGMTNRKDMIDEAILRPGRLELHVEIGLPDEGGRAQILSIHTGELAKNGMLAPEVSLPDIAARTKNYTGAEIEGLVKAACSYVFARQVDPTDLSKEVSFAGVQVTREDFDRALSETQPAFGVREEELQQCCANGIIPFGREFEQTYKTLQRLAAQVTTSERSPLVSILLSGPAGSGKSALAARVAMDSSFPFIKRVSGESLLRFAEDGKSNALQRVRARWSSVGRRGGGGG